MASQVVSHIIGTNCAPDKEQEFNVWYTTHHAPLVMQGPAVEAMRYQRIEDDARYPRYLAIFKYDSEDDYANYLGSALRQKALADIRDSWPEAGDYTEIWSVAFRRIARRGGGGNPKVLHFNGSNLPANTSQADYDRWYTDDHMLFMLRSPYMVEAERYHRIGGDPKYPQFLATYKYESEAALAESKQHFLAGLSTIDRQRHWPDWVWRRMWGRINYRLVSKERKDLVL